MTYKVDECIANVLALKAKIIQMTDEFEAKIKPYKDLKKAMEDGLLAYLLKQKVKSAPTANGTAYWSTKTTFRVEDKDAFRRHVIGSEQWELITWAAAPTACEEWTQTNTDKEPPPGLIRDSIRSAHVRQPTKPRKRLLVPVEGATPLEGGLGEPVEEEDLDEQLEDTNGEQPDEELITPE